MRGNNTEQRPAVRTGVNAETTVDQAPADSRDVSLTNSEDESVMNHRRRKESLRHATFSDHDINDSNSVDAYLRAARTSLEGAANLLSANMQVRVQFEIQTQILTL